MFKPAPPATNHLYLVEGGNEPGSKAKGVSTMNDYKFAESTVASGITLLVSAWFLVAAGAILTDPSSPYTTPHPARAVVTVENTANIQLADVAQAPRLQPVAMAVAPDAHFTITVEAKRLKV